MMADKMESPTALRKLSHIELYSSSRHHLGIYRSVTVTCRYHFPSTPPSETAFLSALAKVVAVNPMLRVGILAEDTNDAHFSHVPRMELRQHVDFSGLSSAAETVAEYDALVADKQGWHHDQLWPDVAARPPWRISVSGAASVVELQRDWDVTFSFHHSLMDGTSGRMFHEKLVAELCHSVSSTSTPTEEGVYILAFPTPPALPERQEDVIDFTHSVTYMIPRLWEAFGPSWLKLSKKYPWGGKGIDFSRPYRTRVQSIDFAPEDLTALLKACKAHSVSLTALLQALVLASLSKRLSPDDVTTFSAATPISLRHYLNASADASMKNFLRVLISSASHEFSASVIGDMRRSDADTDALVWKAAETVKSQLATRLANIPKDDITGLLKFVKDWFGFWNSQNGTPRNSSWEVSNIGVVAKPLAPNPSNDNLKDNDNNGSNNGAKDNTECPRITRVVFTNGAMTTGSAIGLGVGSIAQGALTIGVSWQHDVVDDMVVQGLVEDLPAFAKRLRETGKF